MRDPDFSLRDVAPSREALLFLLGRDCLWLRPSPEGWQLPTLGDICKIDVNASGKFLYVGRLARQECFSSHAEEWEADLPAGGEWLPLRQAFLVLEQAQFAMAGRAIQLQHWLAEHRFCSRCGSPCQRHEKEFAMVCERCQFHQYPRINPCIIVLVTRDEQALLAQGASFPSGFYSCLAGFIEAGENAEQAVRREVREEVGIELGELRYHGSQSWPFPHSLMLGYRASWQAGELLPDAHEIVAANWFDRDALPTRLPPSSSIAGELIQAWLAGN